MSKPEAMEDDGDPVVKEIPVYLSKRLNDKLFIFQYPMKPASDGYDNATFIKTNIKPDNQEVAIEVEINTNDPHYNTNRGQAIAATAVLPSKRDEEDERIFDSHMMDKIVLQSSRALPSCDNYAIGIYQDGEFHLTPLKGIIQMRPQFNYLDRIDKKGKDDGKNDGEDAEEEDEPAKQVNVTFARNVPDFIKKMREQSFQTRAKKSMEEQWIKCDYKPANSNLAELTRMEMICGTNDESVNNLNLSSKQYLDLLAPPIKEEQFSKANIPSHTTSLSYIRTLPLLDQVRILMKDAKVMSFVQLRTILASEHETNAILKYLQQVAVLVQGNWVVNSELIYPKDTMSAHSGIPAELMCRARDYILLSFTEHEFVDRRAVSSVVKLPAEEIREIFTNIAKHQPKKGWRLIVNPSKDFSERYPDIAQRQEMFWEAKRKHLRETMESHNQAPQRQRRKSNRESIGSENEERNAGRGAAGGRKSLRDSSVSDNDSATESIKQKKANRGRKVSETSAMT
ncbi:DNA-directed RNA polymerase III subunit RPC5 [Nasonia vitripennis]|uniref:DNA-directed RNA polymerase III subunit RPC5 n=1 Tax=Nasonia vitripennis TaxID=7425 RepID=A0A7M7GB41_NASVI|nr:DNA-directed RNA polymerase III subunit RPC5 [Nasonia vitripennis]